MRSWVKCVVIMAVVVVGSVFLWNVATKFQPSARSVSFSEFLRDVDSGRVGTISIQGEEVVGVNRQTGPFRTYAHRSYVGLVNRLIERDVEVRVVPEESWSNRCAPWLVMLILTQAGMLALVRTLSQART